MDGSRPTPVDLVTGASAGIGAAIAERLLKHGWTVYAAARRVDRLRALESAGARIVPLDVMNDASMISAIDRIAAEHRRIDALITYAG